MNLRTVAAVTLLTFLSTCSYAQFGRRPGSAAENTNVSVTVHTSDDRPSADARVELRDMNGNLVGSGYTNSSGIFEVVGRFSSGVYEVLATKGLAEARERMPIGGGFASLSVRLPSNSDQDRSVGGAATVSVAQYKVPDKARKLFKKAQEDLEKSKFEEANEHLRKVLEVYPKYAEALCLRGVLKMDGQDREGAMSDFDEAIQIDSSYPMSYFALGAAYNLMSRFDDALRTLDRGTTLAPMAWQGYFEVAKAHIGKAEYALALRQLDKAQAFNREKYPFINLLKGHALLALKQYPEAMQELEAFLQKSPAGPQSDTARKMLNRAQAFAAQHGVET